MLLASLASQSIAFSAASSAAASASAVDSPLFFACPCAFLDLARYLGDLLVRDRRSLDVDLPEHVDCICGCVEASSSRRRFWRV
jgi:hypothetical protein